MWVGVFFKVAILPTICASLSPSLNPPLVTGNRAPICAVIRPNPACRLGRNIIKTSLCCHGNRDLNKFIFLCVCVCMCVFQGLFGIGLVWRLVRVTDRDACCCCSVFSHPHSSAQRPVYFFSHQTSPAIIFYHHEFYSEVQLWLFFFWFVLSVFMYYNVWKRAGETGKDRSVRLVFVNLNRMRKMLSWMNGEKLGQQNTFAPSNLCDRCVNRSLILLRFSPAFVSKCSMAGLVFSIYVLYQ